MMLKKPIHYLETPYGFEWGAGKIIRLFSDNKKGCWVAVGIETSKTDIQVYITKTGKIRICDKKGEWKSKSNKKVEIKN